MHYCNFQIIWLNKHNGQALDFVNVILFSGFWPSKHRLLQNDLFFTLYNKDEATDLITDEKKPLKQAIQDGVGGQEKKDMTKNRKMS